LWVAGFLAITGSPPFGPFLSEFTILKAALDQGRSGVAIAYLVLLAVVFVGMATAVLRMAQGTPAQGDRRMTSTQEPVLSVLPTAALGALVLILGLYLPPALRQTIQEAAQALR
jgi:hydrogenase-4 component F